MSLTQRIFTLIVASMDFAAAKKYRYPEDELQEAARWYSQAIGSGMLESWRRVGLALDERGRVVSEIITPHWPTCNHWGVAVPQKGIWIKRCPRCRESVTWLTVQQAREFFRSVQNDRERVDEEPFSADLWRETMLAAFPWRFSPVPDIPFFFGKGLAVLTTKNTRRRLTFRKLRNTDKDLIVYFDPADPPTQRDIFRAVDRERKRDKRPRSTVATITLLPRDAGIKRTLMVFPLRNNGLMLANGKRWRHVKRPIRKVPVGLPSDIAQLRAEGLTYGEIAKRWGKLESEIRLLVRKLSIRARSVSNSHTMCSISSDSTQHLGG
jgi:hypothetical protein